MHLTYRDSEPHTNVVSPASAGEAGAPEKICDLNDVRGGDTGFPVSLICEENSKRLMLRGINEGGFACVDIDLLDVVEWLHGIVPAGVNVDELASALASFAAGCRSGRHPEGN